VATNNQNENKSNNQNENRSTAKPWLIILIMINVVFILLLTTLGIIALRVGNYLPEGTDILFIVGRNPDVSVRDEQGPWEAGKNVDIFRSSHANENGEITVLSQNGDSVIAPGTLMEYKFTTYNNGNVAVVYETDMDFKLVIGDESQSDHGFPLEVRLTNGQGEYIVGDKDTFVPISEAKVAAHVSVLGAQSYETYTLELLWQFVGVDDALDTALGNQSAEKGVTVTLGINTYAEEHMDPTASGGTAIAGDGKSKQEYGGTVRWLWILLLLINAAMLIFYVTWIIGRQLSTGRKVEKD